MGIVSKILEATRLSELKKIQYIAIILKALNLLQRLVSKASLQSFVTS